MCIVALAVKKRLAQNVERNGQSLQYRAVHQCKGILLEPAVTSPSLLLSSVTTAGTVT